MDETTFTILMILGIIVGNALSVIIPYFRKLSEGKIENFDRKYLWHGITSSLWQSVISVPLWLQWQPPADLSIILAFLVAIAFGFGGKDFQEQVLKYIRKVEAVTTQ